MTQKTPFYDCHHQAGALLVNFAGWQMPLHYGSQLNEHHHVRHDAGMFDVSHMLITDLAPVNDDMAVYDYLRFLLANDVAKLTVGKALYTCMLNQQAGIIDDLIVYRLTEKKFRIVSNAATREKDSAWFKQQAESFAITMTQRNDLALLAVQGPQAIKKVMSVVTAQQAKAINTLSDFHCVDIDDWFFARTGYTGESGLEIALPTEQATQCWDALLDVGVRPCGLGARDTLRLEAGMRLYGQDMDEHTTPLDVGLGWTIAWEPAERNFIGKESLLRQKKQNCTQRGVGLVLMTKGVLRPGQKIFSNEQEIGIITSGSFAPTIGKSIAFARIKMDAKEDLQVAIRNKLFPVNIVKIPFVKNGLSNV